MDTRIYEHPSGWKITMNRDNTGWCVEIWDGIELYEGVHLTSEEDANENFEWTRAALQRRIQEFGTWIVPVDAVRVTKS